MGFFYTDYCRVLCCNIGRGSHVVDACHVQMYITVEVSCHLMRCYLDTCRGHICSLPNSKTSKTYCEHVINSAIHVKTGSPQNHDQQQRSRRKDQAKPDQPRTSIYIHMRQSCMEICTSRICINDHIPQAAANLQKELLFSI